MKKLILFFFSVFILNTYSQNNYEDEWQKIYSLELKGLSLSASKEVEKIYQEAKKTNNSPQLIKALLYKSKFTHFEENSEYKIIKNLNNEIEHASSPTKNILESILANIYYQYLKENRWKLYKRNNNVENDTISDYRVWNLNKLFFEIQNHYINSLNNEILLKKTPLKKYNEILSIEEESKIYRPTLYDFLAHNALDFFKTNEYLISQPKENFTINSEKYFIDFLSVKLNHKDSTSQKINTLQIFKKLGLFHKNDSNPDAYVRIMINTLDYIYLNSMLKNKDELILSAYKKLSDDYRKFPISTLVDFKLAKINYKIGQKYTPTKNKEFQFFKKKALSICETAIKLFPNSEGTKNCKLLKEKILASNVSIKSEKHIPCNKPSRVLVDYKNLNQLNFKIFKLPFEEKEKFEKSRSDSAKLAIISKLKLLHQWKSNLKNEEDYQNHTTEIIIPRLTNGNYLIFTSPKNDILNNSEIIAYTHIQVTDLALIESKQGQNYLYQVVNRNTGAPIKKAKVKLEASKEFNDKALKKTYYTNKDGQISLKSRKDYDYVTATITTNDDIAKFEDYSLAKKYKNNYLDDEEEYLIEPFLFTDRSIYRPGQKVYFKGLFFKKNKTEKELFTNEFIEVTVYNPNHEEVKQFDLKLNEYGSLSGEFTIPNNGLTGNYYFEFDESYEYDSDFFDDEYFEFQDKNFSFSVEEYKRPKFSTEFNPVKKTYKLNDSITVRGKATAFSGSIISNAQVKYTVKRTARFPSWYSQTTYSPELEICHGTTITDTKGNYKITFKAIPDIKVDKINLPTFNYKISASVTDINGETHDANTNVKVGYHTLKLAVKINDKIDKNTFTENILIDAKNLNNHQQSAKGNLQIFKIIASSKPQRNRCWEAPDYQNISKEKFKELFPHEPYQNNIKTSRKLVLEKQFNTEDSLGIELDNIKNWAPGKYLAIATSKDNYGQLVKTEKSFSLYSLNEKKVADNKLFFIKTDKKSYLPGENINLTIGSASKDLTVNLFIQKEGEKAENQIVHLSNETKSIFIPVTKNDIGGFTIKYHYVNYNQYKNNQLYIAVPKTTNSLTIETISFRDLLEPGSKQTWAFKIKGKEKDKIAAEVLASMYDASLDEFKNHNWNLASDNYYDSYYYSNYDKVYTNARNSFGTKNFTIKNRRWVSNNYAIKKFDHLNWFGFSLKNSNVKNQNYLKNLQSQRKEFDGTISGTITDEDGAPLPGVNITIEDTAYGTISDFDGNYNLKVKKGDLVTITMLGYESHIIKVSNKSIINIKLKEDSNHLEEVVVIGYGTSKKRNLTGSVSTVKSEVLDGRVSGVTVNNTAGAGKNIIIRGSNSLNSNNTPLYIIDGAPFTKGELNISDVDILSMEILKGSNATAIYGSRAANGVIIINTKSGQKKIEEELNQIKARKNFDETAFFYPNLRTDENGNVSFEFSIPEATTKWKMQLLAHSKDARHALKTLTTVTQKKLMVTPNTPRFLREKDTILITSKISNLTTKELNGIAQLKLTNALNGKNIDTLTNNLINQKSFTTSAKGNTIVTWKIIIPKNIGAIQYKIVAKAGNFSDGEQNVLPVLSSRKLITESIPLWSNANQTKNFILKNLNSNSSSTLSHHKLTLELTSNPAWYALQALPYLIEYPYDCAEQTFSKYFANTLASHTINTSPKIKEVFKNWNDNNSMLSNLEKNQDLKSLLIQETPWLRDAQSETEQKKRIALLFDLDKLKTEKSNTLEKLKQMQLSNGGFPWFKGSNYANRDITQHILAGFGHLKDLGIVKLNKKENKIIKRGLAYLDKEILKDYQTILEEAKWEAIKEKSKSSNYLNKKHISSVQLHYLYLRSFYPSNKIEKETNAAIEFFKKQAKTHWKYLSIYNQGLVALILNKENDKTSTDIIKSLKEKSTYSEELGTYWKENISSWKWYESQIETQTLLTEVFSKIDKDLEFINSLKRWLITNKRTNRWETTKATTEAIYTLLKNNNQWKPVNDSLKIKVGAKNIPLSEVANLKIEAGTGYYKKGWNSNEINNKMSKVIIDSQNNQVLWGALHWQYFEELDKIPTAETNIKLTKELYLKKNTSSGIRLVKISNSDSIKVGDLITVRLKIQSDRDLDFVHMKDLRASGLEPVETISGYKSNDGLGYYQSIKDASTNFFFDKIKKGYYVFDYDLRANNAGSFSNGICNIQCMYAPEFNSHSSSKRITILPHNTSP